MNPNYSKWDFVAPLYNRATFGFEFRYKKYKTELFGKCRGKTLLVAIGTGNDLDYFREDQPLVAIDFSEKMIGQAQTRKPRHPARVDLIRTDVESLPFRSASFDSVVTSCTFCSVPNPVGGLKEIHRVLKPGGILLMFEHVRSENPLLGLMQDGMTLLTREFGPDMNRRTGRNIRLTGFRLTREFNVYLDLMKMFEAIKS